MTEPMHEPQQPETSSQADAPSQTAAPSNPAAPSRPAAPAPSPASVNGDVPVENWRRDLEQIGDAPSTERHGLLSTLLDDLDAQVSSL